MRIAVVSCSNLPWGFFNGYLESHALWPKKSLGLISLHNRYGAVAKRAHDVDLVIHLGVCMGVHNYSGNDYVYPSELERPFFVNPGLHI